MDSVRFHWIPNGSMGFYRIPGFQDSVLSPLSIIHEFNCLQTIYMYTMKANEFVNRPFTCRIDLHKFLCGSFFYAFVDHSETKRNLSDAFNDLFQRDSKLLTVINDLFTIISTI